MKTFRAERSFPAWPWGGTGLHAIGSAGAVRGRSTGGRSGHSGPTPPHPPLRPPEHTGCNDGQRGAPVAISDGTRAAPVNLLHPPQQLQQLRRNSDPRQEVLSAGFGARQKDEGSLCSPRP